MKRLLRRGGIGVLAGMGSAALLLGAFGFQYIGGLAPCALCIWQRWPHAIAVLLGIIGLRMHGFWVAILGAAAAFSSASVGIFHTGVEQGWWKGLASCAGGEDLSKLTPEQALQVIMNAEIVRCDEIAWQMLGLSMASWNAVFSICLAGLWVAEAVRRKRSAAGAA